MAQQPSSLSHKAQYIKDSLVHRIPKYGWKLFNIFVDLDFGLMADAIGYLTLD